MRNGWGEDVESSRVASQGYHIEQHRQGNPRAADGCASKPSPGRAGGAGPLTAATSAALDAAAPKPGKSVKGVWTCGNF